VPLDNRLCLALFRIIGGSPIIRIRREPNAPAAAHRKSCISLISSFEHNNRVLFSFQVLQYISGMITE
jgi:hypothetical protein